MRIVPSPACQSFAFSRASFSAINARISSTMLRSSTNRALYNVTGKRPAPWGLPPHGSTGSEISAMGQLLPPWTFHVSLSFKLIELIGQQDSTSWRAYSHVHVTSSHGLLCLLQRLRSCGASNIDARKLIVSADQELHLRRASHARRPPQ